MQLLRDNLTLWTSDAAGDNEEGGDAGGDNQNYIDEKKNLPCVYNSHRKIKTKTEKKNREKPVRCRNRQRAQPTRVLKMWEKMI